MSIKKIVSTQYKQIVDATKSQVANLKIPPEGWLCTVRKALGMSGVQLATRLGVTRSQVSKTEHEELNGRVTMHTMQKMAEAMGCRFIYAIVPPQGIQDLILTQATLKVRYIVKKANIQMALENQLLSDEQIQFEIDRLTQEILTQMPSDLWSSEWEDK